MTESADWTCCIMCGSRATRRHCTVLCGWVTCKECGATTGVMALYDEKGKFTGWRHAGFPWQDRTME